MPTHGIATLAMMDLVCRGGTVMRRLRIWLSTKAAQWSHIASMCQPP